MKRRYFRKRLEEKKAALERIKILFQLAKQEFKKHPERSHRYAQMINDLIKKIRVRPEPGIRRYICRKCNHFLVEGKTLNITEEGDFLVYTCLNCGDSRKYPKKPK